jgi:hypothetical protein
VRAAVGDGLTRCEARGVTRRDDLAWRDHDRSHTHGELCRCVYEEEHCIEIGKHTTLNDDANLEGNILGCSLYSGSAQQGRVRDHVFF